MSYPTQPPAAVLPVSPSGRPSVVSAAAVLLWVMAAVGLIYAVVTLAVVPGTISRFRNAIGGTVNELQQFNGGTDPDTYVGVVWLGAAIALVLAVILFALYIVLGIALRRGSNTARIATLVICGLGAVAGAGALLALAIERGGDPAPWSLGEQLTRAYPSGWLGVNITLATSQIIAYVLVAVLVMAAPRIFFRAAAAPAPAAAPVSAPSGYPQYGAPYPAQQPGYGPPAQAHPTAPGYPPAPGYPAAQGYPTVPGYPPAPGHPPALGHPAAQGYPAAPGYHPVAQGYGPPPSGGYGVLPPSGHPQMPSGPGYPGAPAGPGYPVAQPGHDPASVWGRPSGEPQPAAEPSQTSPGSTTNQPAEAPGATANQPAEAPGTTTDQPAEAPGATTDEAAKAPEVTTEEPTEAPKPPAEGDNLWARPAE
jgi:hypothetical protein